MDRGEALARTRGRLQLSIDGCIMVGYGPTDLLDAEIAVRRVLGAWSGEFVFLDLKPVPLTTAEREHFERRLVDIRRQIHAAEPLRL